MNIQTQNQTREIKSKERPDPETVADSRQDFANKIKTTPEIKGMKGAPLSKEIVEIHISAGKKTNMRPSDIVGTISNIEGVTAEDIGIISVADISTFVDIMNNKGEMVLEALQERAIKGRIRKVSRVTHK
jgi:hypothetical protein